MIDVKRTTITKRSSDSDPSKVSKQKEINLTFENRGNFTVRESVHCFRISSFIGVDDRHFTRASDQFPNKNRKLELCMQNHFPTDRPDFRQLILCIWNALETKTWKNNGEKATILEITATY